MKFLWRKIMQAAKWLLDTGSILAGELAKEAIKLLPGGGTIIVGAEFVGALTESVISDVATRQLSKREEMKVSAAATFALSTLKKKLDTGHTLRSDDRFFANNENYRSNAEEVLEGVLLQCKREHEEKKIEYISSIFANIAFNDEIKIAEANHILKIAENLTYRQLIILSVLNANEFGKLNLRKESQAPAPDYWEISLLQEILELEGYGLIRQVSLNYFNNDPTPEYMKERILANDYEDITIDSLVPNALVTTTIGDVLHNLMDLKEISKADFEKIKVALS